MVSDDEDPIPTLTDPVAPGILRPQPGRGALPEDLRVELETELAARVHELTEGLVQEAVRRIEGVLAEELSTHLRERLPEIGVNSEVARQRAQRQCALAVQANIVDAERERVANVPFANGAGAAHQHAA